MVWLQAVLEKGINVRVIALLSCFLVTMSCFMSQCAPFCILHIAVTSKD